MSLPRLFLSSKGQSAIVVAMTALTLAILGLVTGKEALAAVVLAATGYMLSTGIEDAGRKKERDV